MDLDKDGSTPKNHFGSVAEAIHEKYSDVQFQCESFRKGQGKNKLARIEEFVKQQRPVIVSLANAPYGGKGWHIMVVVDATTDALVLLEYVDESGKITTRTISKEQFVAIHDNYEGGDEVAYLQHPVVAPNLKEERGDCYKVAYEEFMELSQMEEFGFAKEKGWKLPPLFLVHGTAIPPIGPDAGKTIKHAWIETAGDVLELSNGNKNRYSIEVWKNDYKAVVRVKYQKEEAQKLAEKTGHFGPWDD